MGFFSIILTIISPLTSISRLPFQTEEIGTDSSLEKADKNLHLNHTLNSLNDKDLTVREEHSAGKTGLVHSTHELATKSLLSQALHSSHQP